MTIALALLLGSAIVALAAPALLRHLGARAVDPVAVIVCWVLAVLGVSITVCAGLAIMAMPGYAADTPFVHLVGRRWWSAVQDAPHFAAYNAAAWAAVVVLTAAGLRFTWVAVRHGRARRALVRDRLHMLRTVGTTVLCREGGPTTLWVRSERALAFSLAGRPGTIVVTDGLRRQLSSDGIAAVLAHERAHLRGRHHMITAWAEVVSVAFPFVMLFRAASPALREQVEIAADIAATRSSGREALRSALLDVTGFGAPGVALAMARDAVALRLRYLAAVTEPPSLLGRLSRCGTLGVLFAVTPLLAAAVLLWVTSALATALP
ncbi:MAG TPA: M56 family metallopeptidase [Pseudonocardia sp.]|jgi:Zn-dependent protease with chaperone function